MIDCATQNSENVAFPDGGSLGKRRVGYVVDRRRLLPGYHIDRASEQKLHPDEPAGFFATIFHQSLLQGKLRLSLKLKNLN